MRELTRDSLAACPPPVGLRTPCYRFRPYPLISTDNDVAHLQQRKYLVDAPITLEPRGDSE